MTAPERILTYIQKTYQPEAVVVYGSFADGSAGAGSDFDALVIAGSRACHDASEIDGVTLDVFVYPAATFCADYDPENFERIAVGHENDPERGARCMLCYELRLRKTAEFMEAHNAGSELPFDYFASTLSLSPLKNAEALNSIAEQIAGQKHLQAELLRLPFLKGRGSGA